MDLMTNVVIICGVLVVHSDAWFDNGLLGLWGWFMITAVCALSMYGSFLLFLQKQDNDNSLLLKRKLTF